MYISESYQKDFSSIDTEKLTASAVISNTLAVPTDKIFSLTVEQINSPTAWLGAICYTLQIYYDFSGYSDMAIGLGSMLGFSFPENFSLPYTAKSIREFWKKWHISLSSWFRDYLYIPLGGNRKGNVYIHLIIVFFMTGLWHGASWNFVVWGLWHGSFSVIERVLSKKIILKENIFFYLLKRSYTILVVVVGWVFFRADDLKFAIDYLYRMFTGRDGNAVLYGTSYFMDNFAIFIFIFALLSSMGIWVYFEQYIGRITKSIVFRDVCIVGGMLISMMFVMSSTYNPFIYFRF